MRALGQPALSRPAEGLYDPRFEHDACGVAFVATLTGVPSRTIVDQALTALRNLDHRGAAGAEINSGDGAGILFQVPDAFLREVVDFDLPPHHSYAVGTGFFAGDADDVTKSRQLLEEIAAEEGLQVLGWREVPVQAEVLGSTARSAMPTFVQVFVAGAGSRVSGMALERRAFCLRKRAEKEADVYFPSLSARTLVYKGMLTTDQLDHFFPDLADPRVASALAVVHSRFSTNTFPSWPLAHPFRYIAHNGEINTVMGNRNWMRAREALLDSDLIPGDLDRLYPICTPGASDSASFDEVLELLHIGGRSLPHAVLMMIPEAWENHAEMDAKRRAFYEFHSALMEPWDGPAVRGVQRRQPDRRRPRPQRPAPLALLGDRRRPRRAGLRGRRPRHRPVEDRAQGPPPAGPDVPRRHRRAPHHRGRGGQGRAGRRAPVRRVAARRPGAPRRRARARAHRAHPRLGHPAPADLRLHRGGAAHPAHPDGQHRRRADRLDGHRLADRGAECEAADDLRLLQPAVRAGHQPAPRRDPRGARHLPVGEHRPRGQPARPDAGVVPPDRAAVPGLLQRRPGQDPPHQPRGRHARLRDAPVPGPVRRRGRRRGAGAAASTRSASRCPPRSPAAPGSSCSPTATPPPSSRRSRRCC